MVIPGAFTTGVGIGTGGLETGGNVTGVATVSVAFATIVDDAIAGEVVAKSSFSTICVEDAVSVSPVLSLVSSLAKKINPKPAKSVTEITAKSINFLFMR